jgi:hypothetical protein
MANTIINVRSPYWIKQTITAVPAGGGWVKALKLKIWSGDLVADKPASDTYLFTDDIATGETFVLWEIAELVRDYINIDPVLVLDIPDDNNLVWVEWNIIITDGVGTEEFTGTLLASDGYGYFKEEANPVEANPILMEEGKTFRIPAGENIVVPVYTENVANVYYRQDTTFLIQDIIPPTDISGRKIEYSFLNTGTWPTINNIRIVDRSAGEYVFQVEIIQPCRYTPNLITFVNKYGALENLWMWAKKVDSIQTTAETYKANTIDSVGEYAVSDHVYKEYNVNGKGTFVLNTGYLTQAINETINQLMLSEQIWIRIDSVLTPVTIKSKNIQYKTVLDDKLIDYTITFETAYDLINNIR